ncbi:hypothetical protein FUA23_19745 [Neolewinella aurantiaca]|uniref:Uncharacterized protein n=1 Tax=Neolewinella aurantiaca TaxID=2602767 RepID=A0A5C7FLL4_9BACT|nr:hypothetical protein [Neolewinella aurantiaca]TXF86276.1 hypothetical protein FUA23_19745 [Neolewinella aurantiaca]
MTSTITVPTEDYGPAGFEIKLSPDGEVLAVTSASAQLPETVFRITYGDRWESAREYFQQLADNLAYRAEAAAWINDSPPEFKLLRRTFRKTSPLSSPAGGNDAPLYARRASFWLEHPEARPALFLQKKAKDAFRVIAKLLRSGNCDAEALEPWLFSIIHLVREVEDRRVVYQLIGLLDTPGSAEYLFSELERPGRHPFASGLLNALIALAVPANKARILELQHSLLHDRGQVKDYLRVISRLEGDDVHQSIMTVLDEHPSLAGEVFSALRATHHPSPGTVIRGRFDQEENLRLFDLIAELIDREPPGIRVTLGDMNAKVDTPSLNTAAPVTWPQMLGPNWRKLVVSAQPDELFGLILSYLNRSEPWLQRCALLQLDTWVQAQKATPEIPLPIEQRIRELLTSRYEKIYTVVLNVADKIFDQLTEPTRMIEAVLAHAPNSNYRLMNVAVLKKAAARPEWRQLETDLLRSAFHQVTSVEELSRLERLLPYLSFLGIREELRIIGAQKKAEIGAAKQ